MLKKILFSCFLFATFTSLVVSQDYTKDCLEPVVMLQNETKDMTGSAVIIDSRVLEDGTYLNIIFTCDHVLTTNMNAVTMKYDQGFVDEDKSFIIQPIYRNEPKDLAIAMFISKTFMPIASLDMESAPKIKDHVFAIGCGLGEPPRYTEGVVTNLGSKKLPYDTIQANIYIVPGDSGSPLYYKNKVIGITSAIRSYTHAGKTHAANGISMFKPIKILKPILESERFNFVLKHQNPYPKVLAEYIWIKDAKLSAD